MNLNNFQAVGRERSGVYTCHVITEDQDHVMEAAVFVDVLPENGHSEDSIIIKSSPRRMPSQEKTNTATVKTKILSNSPEIIETEKVMASGELDLSGKGSNNYSEDKEEEEIPSKAEIAFLVSNSMKIIFRQLSDIDQRLKHIEKKVLNEQ